MHFAQRFFAPMQCQRLGPKGAKDACAAIDIKLAFLQFLCREPMHPRNLRPWPLAVYKPLAIESIPCHCQTQHHRRDWRRCRERHKMQTGPSIGQQQHPFCRHKYNSHCKPHLCCDNELAAGYIGYNLPNIDVFKTG